MATDLGNYRARMRSCSHCLDNGRCCPEQRDIISVTSGPRTYLRPINVHPLITFPTKIESTAEKQIQVIEAPPSSLDGRQLPNLLRPCPPEAPGLDLHKKLRLNLSTFLMVQMCSLDMEIRLLVVCLGKTMWFLIYGNRRGSSL